MLVCGVWVAACGKTSEESPVTDASGTDATDGTTSDGADSAPALDTAIAADAVDSKSPLPVDGGPYTSTGLPPARPSASSTGGATKWFAFDAMKLGLTDRATGLSKPTAWQDYGYNLDDRLTSATDSLTSTNSCKRLSGSPSKVLADGTLGIDNNFGQHFMAVMKSLKADTEDALNKYFADGYFTLLLRLDNVGPDDNAKVPGALYVAGRFSTTVAPTFTTADRWPVTSDSLLDGVDLTKPRVTFPAGYMAKGVWVSSDIGSETVDLKLPFLGGVLPLESGVLSVRVSDGADGTIAGGTLTSTVTTVFTTWLKSFGVCAGTAVYDQCVETLTLSADLVSAAPKLQDTTKPCNALSIGLGFTMKPTGEPKSVVAPTPLPSGCP